jgi:hypothetical protein
MLESFLGSYSSFSNSFLVLYSMIRSCLNEPVDGLGHVHFFGLSVSDILLSEPRTIDQGYQVFVSSDMSFRWYYFER